MYYEAKGGVREGSPDKRRMRLKGEGVREGRLGRRKGRMRLKGEGVERGCLVIC